MSSVLQLGSNNSSSRGAGTTATTIVRAGSNSNNDVMELELTALKTEIDDSLSEVYAIASEITTVTTELETVYEQLEQAPYFLSGMASSLLHLQSIALKIHLKCLLDELTYSRNQVEGHREKLLGLVRRRLATAEQTAVSAGQRHQQLPQVVEDENDERAKQDDEEEAAAGEATDVVEIEEEDARDRKIRVIDVDDIKGEYSRAAEIIEEEEDDLVSI